MTPLEKLEKMVMLMTRIVMLMIEKVMLTKMLMMMSEKGASEWQPADTAATHAGNLNQNIIYATIIIIIITTIIVTIIPINTITIIITRISGKRELKEDIMVMTLDFLTNDSYPPSSTAAMSPCSSCPPPPPQQPQSSSSQVKNHSAHNFRLSVKPRNFHRSVKTGAQLTAGTSLRQHGWRPVVLVLPDPRAR